MNFQMSTRGIVKANLHTLWKCSIVSVQWIFLKAMSEQQTQEMNWKCGNCNQTCKFIGYLTCSGFAEYKVRTAVNACRNLTVPQRVTDNEDAVSLIR